MFVLINLRDFFGKNLGQGGRGKIKINWKKSLGQSNKSDFKLKKSKGRGGGGVVK